MLYLLIFALLLFWYSDILSLEIKVRVRCFARAFFVPSRAKKTALLRKAKSHKLHIIAIARRKNKLTEKKVFRFGAARFLIFW